MPDQFERPQGVYLSSLDAGSAIDLETKSRHYLIEYLDGNRVRISGHPQWCPRPVLARLHGSRGGSGGFEEGYIGRGMCLVFERLDNCIPVATSEIMDIRLVHLN
jgi:hypothetical protein